MLYICYTVEESLNGILDNSDDEAEQDDVVNKILDEIGIEVNQKVLFFLCVTVNLS